MRTTHPADSIAATLDNDTAHGGTRPEKPPAPPEPVAFHYVQTDSVVALLAKLGASLVVSTYQANKVLAIRAQGPGLSVLVRTFDRPMGLTVNRRRLVIGARNQIWTLRNAPDIAPRIEPAGVHDACFLPRSAHVTGDIGIHEIAWAGDQLWVVSTRFSCLATLDDEYSFVPQWRPPFITELAAEDRCHLNGLAIRDGQPAFVTALGETDTPGGWRPSKAQGGVIIDVASGELVERGLSMPHSPRWHEGKLWVLESGTGGVVRIDQATGRRETVVQLPGFTRGWALVGPYAFVGLSKIRPTSAMDGVPIAERRDELMCGVAVVDLRRGAAIGLLEFRTAVEEIFDVQLLAGSRFPEVIGFQKETVDHTFVVPPSHR
ncbi:MAG: TIGR03032 family protein [Pirellulales bacterium]